MGGGGGGGGEEDDDDDGEDERVRPRKGKDGRDCDLPK